MPREIVNGTEYIVEFEHGLAESKYLATLTGDTSRAKIPVMRQTEATTCRILCGTPSAKKETFALIGEATVKRHVNDTPDRSYARKQSLIAAIANTQQAVELTKGERAAIWKSANLKGLVSSQKITKQARKLAAV